MKARACSPYLRRCGNISMGVDLKQLCATTHGFARHDNVSLSLSGVIFLFPAVSRAAVA